MGLRTIGEILGLFDFVELLGVSEKLDYNKVRRKTEEAKGVKMTVRRKQEKVLKRLQDYPMTHISGFSIDYWLVIADLVLAGRIIRDDKGYLKVRV